MKPRKIRVTVELTLRPRIDDGDLPDEMDEAPDVHEIDLVYLFEPIAAALETEDNLELLAGSDIYAEITDAQVTNIEDVEI